MEFERVLPILKHTLYIKQQQMSDLRHTLHNDGSLFDITTGYRIRELELHAEDLVASIAKLEGTH